VRTFINIWSLIKKVYPKISIARVVVRTVYFSLICSKNQRDIAVRYLTAITNGYHPMVVVSFIEELSDEETSTRLLRVGTVNSDYNFGAPISAIGHKKVMKELFPYIMGPDARFLVNDPSINVQEGTMVACLKNKVIDLSTGHQIAAERTFT
jgi:hypothetical protein